MSVPQPISLKALQFFDVSTHFFFPICVFLMVSSVAIVAQGDKTPTSKNAEFFIGRAQAENDFEARNKAVENLREQIVDNRVAYYYRNYASPAWIVSDENLRKSYLLFPFPTKDIRFEEIRNGSGIQIKAYIPKDIAIATFEKGLAEGYPVRKLFMDNYDQRIVNVALTSRELASVLHSSPDLSIPGFPNKKILPQIAAYLNRDAVAAAKLSDLANQQWHYLSENRKSYAAYVSLDTDKSLDRAERLLRELLDRYHMGSFDFTSLPKHLR